MRRDQRAPVSQGGGNYGDSVGSTEPSPDEKTPRKNVPLDADNGAVAGGENPAGSGGAAAGGLVGKRRDAGPKRWQARFSKWLAERHHKGGKVAAPSAADVHALKLSMERIETKLLGSIQEEQQAHTEELLRETKGALPSTATGAVRARWPSKQNGGAWKLLKGRGETHEERASASKAVARGQ